MVNSGYIDSLLDQLNWSPYHNKLFFNCFGGWLLGSMWFAACSLMTGMFPDLTAFERTFLGAMLNAGGVTGSLLFSYLSDKHGRVAVYKRIVFASILGAMLLLSSVRYEMMVGALFLIGMGAGGDSATPTNVMLDFTPSRFKGRLALLNLGSGCGPVTAHLTALLFSEFWTYDVAIWRMLTLVGLFVTLVFAWTRRHLLESPYYLYNKGDNAYISVIQAIGSQDLQLHSPSTLSEPLISDETRECTDKHIFDQNNWATTLKLHACQFLSSYSATSLVFFLTLYYDFEDPNQLYVILTVMQVSGIVCMTQSAFLVESRLGRRWTYSLCYLIAGIVVLAYLLTNQFWVLLVAAAVYNGLVQNGSAAKGLIGPESYEPSIRGQGVGVLSGLSRCAGIVAPLGTGLVAGCMGKTGCMLVMSGTFVLTGLIAGTLKETKPSKKRHYSVTV